SRGLGTLREENGTKYVNEDFYMSTIDVVSDPSAPEAWVNGIFEGKEFYMGDDEEFIDKVKDQINKEASKTGFSMVDEAVTLIAFEKMMQRLNG
ncbi:MAG: primosomal protein, partial [Epsilonproteobacteria bacterium]